MLTWKGVGLTKRLRRAQAEAINTTLAACVLHAKQNHGPGAHGMHRFETQTGALERSVGIVEHATSTFTGVRGVWGSSELAYAHRIEVGYQGKDAQGRVVDAQAYPFLIPAADVEYPKLAGRIRNALRGR